MDIAALPGLLGGLHSDLLRSIALTSLESSRGRVLTLLMAFWIWRRTSACSSSAISACVAAFARWAVDDRWSGAGVVRKPAATPGAARARRVETAWLLDRSVARGLPCPQQLELRRPFRAPHRRNGRQGAVRRRLGAAAQSRQAASSCRCSHARCLCPGARSPDGMR